MGSAAAAKPSRRCSGRRSTGKRRLVVLLHLELAVETCHAPQLRDQRRLSGTARHRPLLRGRRECGRNRRDRRFLHGEIVERDRRQTTLVGLRSLGPLLRPARPGRFVPASRPRMPCPKTRSSDPACRRGPTRCGLRRSRASCSDYHCLRFATWRCARSSCRCEGNGVRGDEQLDRGRIWPAPRSRNDGPACCSGSWRRDAEVEVHVQQTCMSSACARVNRLGDAI